MSQRAPRSALFAFADRHVDEHAALDPIFATTSGIPGYDHLLPGFDTAHHERAEAFTERALAELETISAVDDVDRVAKSVMHERLSARLDLERAGETRRTFSVLWSPVSEIRQVFELMPTDGAEAADVLTERLIRVPEALGSWRTCLEDLVARGESLSRRHVIGIAHQASTYAEGAFAHVARRASGAADDAANLLAAGVAADAACGSLATWLATALQGALVDDDASGPLRYELWSQQRLGAAPATDELYEWGWQDLQRINARMWELAGLLAPGAASLAEVAARLDADDANCVFGVEEMLTRLEALTQAAIEQLDGRHFDIDERIRSCEAREAPAGSAAAPYYISPSEDLSRPGSTWFPTLGLTRFPWWRNVSTWYHEGVPGHHLESANSMLLADRLCRFQRLEAWTSGYGEGWALYAERLMHELGFFDDAAVELGYLSGQALRAARIVVDIGLHLGYDAPADLGELRGADCGGEKWTAEMAVALLEERALIEREFAVSEVDRYLGNPAQAIAYKAGERVWLDVRAEATARLGRDFDLKSFHRQALGLGPMGLDPFRAEMARWDGR